VKKQGVLVAICGINNLGKTTQREFLTKRLESAGVASADWKYARYDIAPSGPMLNDYLRRGNPYNLTPREFQMLQALNRTQVEPLLIEHLSRGDVVIVEDYVGTSIALGVGAGVEESFLRNINSHLRKETLAILLDGERFSEGIEKGHAHESHDTLTNRVRNIHLELAAKHGWKIVDANRTREEVHKEIWQYVATCIS
jgi:thymidylate kinase